LTVDIDFNSRLVNFVEEGIDFSIRYGRLEDSGLVARKLVDRSLVAVASPEYLAQQGRPEHPLALLGHQCIIANSDQWLFKDQGEPLEVKVSGRWRSNSSRSLVQACQAGLGVAYMPASSLGSALHDGSLEQILAPYGSRDITTWVVYANRQYLPARARLAVNFLLEYFKDWRE